MGTLLEYTYIHILIWKTIIIILLFEQFYQVATHAELVPFWEPNHLEAESFDLVSSFSSLGT